MCCLRSSSSPVDERGAPERLVLRAAGCTVSAEPVSVSGSRKPSPLSGRVPSNLGAPPLGPWASLPPFSRLPVRFYGPLQHYAVSHICAFVCVSAPCETAVLRWPGQPCPGSTSSDSPRGFSAWVLLTFGAQSLCVPGACPVQCGMFSSIPGLYPLGASNVHAHTHTSCDGQKCLPTCQCPRAPLPVRAHSVHTHWLTHRQVLPTLLPAPPQTS